MPREEAEKQPCLTLWGMRRHSSGDAAATQARSSDASPIASFSLRDTDGAHCRGFAIAHNYFCADLRAALVISCAHCMAEFELSATKDSDTLSCLPSFVTSDQSPASLASIRS